MRRVGLLPVGAGLSVFCQRHIPLTSRTGGIFCGDIMRKAVSGILSDGEGAWVVWGGTGDSGCTLGEPFLLYDSWGES